MGSHLKLLALSLLLAFTAGCASVERFGSKLDIVATRLGDNGQLVHEGAFEASRQVGSMTAIQFADGHFFDVSVAPSSLVRGDTVRIYKTDDGYEARLWKAAKDMPLANTPQTTARRGS